MNVLCRDPGALHVVDALHFQCLVGKFEHSLAVCDENDCFIIVFHDVFEQFTLGLGIQRAGGLVEKHDGLVSDERPSYGDALCLPLAESAAALVAWRVEPLGQVEDKCCAALLP